MLPSAYMVLNPAQPVEGSSLNVRPAIGVAAMLLIEHRPYGRPYHVAGVFLLLAFWMSTAFIGWITFMGILNWLFGFQ